MNKITNKPFVYSDAMLHCVRDERMSYNIDYYWYAYFFLKNIQEPLWNI